MLLEVKPRITEKDLERRNELIFEEVHRRLLFYSDPKRSIDDVYDEFEDNSAQADSD